MTQADMPMAQMAAELRISTSHIYSMLSSRRLQMPYHYVLSMTFVLLRRRIAAQRAARATPADQMG